MKNLFCIVISLLLSLFVYSQDGTQDSTFGQAGILKFKIGDNNFAKDIIFLENNHFISAGNYFVSVNSPYNPQLYLSKHFSNGLFAQDFGVNGIIDSLQDSVSQISQIELLQNGKILAIGSSGKLKLFSFDQNGNLNTAFGVDGIADSPYSFLFDLLSDGRIITTGPYYDGTKGYFHIASFNSDGSPDSSFGNHGSVFTDVTPERLDYTSAIKVQADDKILLAGLAYTAGPGIEEKAVVARYNPDGSIDSTFGNHGILSLPVGDAGGYGTFRCIDVQKDGKIILGGTAIMIFPGNFNAPKSMLVRLNSDGSLDSSFADQGIKIFNNVTAGTGYFFSIRVLPDQSIVAAGHVTESSVSLAYCAKLDSTGNVVADFGENGIYKSDLNNSQTNTFYKIKMRNDGKLFLCGTSSDTISFNNKSAAIVCLNNTLKINESTTTEVQIYPNPSKGEFIISGITNNSIIKIYNELGQEIEFENFIISENELRLISTFSAGMYFINISGQKRTIKRIVVY